MKEKRRWWLFSLKCFQKYFLLFPLMNFVSKLYVFEMNWRPSIFINHPLEYSISLSNSIKISATEIESLLSLCCISERQKQIICKQSFNFPLCILLLDSFISVWVQSWCKWRLKTLHQQSNTEIGIGKWNYELPHLCSPDMTSAAYKGKQILSPAIHLPNRY